MILRSGHLRYLIPLAATVVWMDLIFYLSSSPNIGFGFSGPSEGIETLQGINLQSSLAHIFLYAALTGLAYITIWLWRQSMKISWKQSLGIVLFATTYGVLNEVNQIYVDGRSASVGDALLNAGGAMAAAFALRWAVMQPVFGALTSRSEIES